MKKAMPVGISDLQDLILYLYKHHDVKPILLIDEYDVPIQAGFMA